MKKLSFNVSDKTLSLSEWGGIKNNVPTLYRIEKGSACLVIPGMPYNIFISEKSAIDNLFSLTETQEISPAPNLGISESFFLKALAITQDPKLARELL